MKGYYFITDEGLSAAGVMSDVRQAVTAGAQIIQYRNKTADTRRQYEEAREIRGICAETRSKLIINDRIDIALAVGADGAHIGNEDLPYAEARRLLGRDAIIGVTVHDVEEAVAAEKAGADYLGVSPVFATGTKSDAGAPCGVETLTAIRRACRVPVVAIGGIDLLNADECIAAGADMVCAISAVVTRPDVFAEIIKFQRKYGL
ncbi:MAG TPA: thiamine phosphate synthase [Spirochaetota bacterium]|nr:thiamine phosphate synthase [Spirochaetota bacterium]HOD16037.1 thiamine phosphate synthase [Spirochaetota bacterium]HPG51021.1 thiamine phosphate synthase [Spirochaetota bacterium]HPN10936.1 thiamine phosphate synthase [Spirochaetota bacterium]